MKPSSPFSTPRKRRTAARNVTAAVPSSEAAGDSPPPHPRVQQQPISATQLQPKRKAGPEMNSLAQRPPHPVSSPAQPPSQPTVRPPAGRPEAPTLHPPRLTQSLDFRQCRYRRGPCGEQSRAILHFTCPSHKHEADGRGGALLLYWWPYIFYKTWE